MLRQQCMLMIMVSVCDAQPGLERVDRIPVIGRVIADVPRAAVFKL